MTTAKVCRCEDVEGNASERRSSRFAPAGPLALNPAAYGLDFFFAPEPEEPKALREDGVAVVRIVGPLDHHRSWWSESYEAIRERFDEAVALKPKGILLEIDSPGGLVSGCFELAAHMRGSCAAAGIPLYAYIQGMGASAAYALACAASKIGTSATSMVGSIGVIDALVDATAYDAAWGLKWRLVTSGSRKADGNPHQEITDAAELATQNRVNELAAIFWDHVASARPNLSAEQVRALNADIFVGARALTLGLVDALSDPSLQIEASDAAKSSNEETSMADDSKDDDKKDESATSKARKILKAAADDGDEDAKKALAAMGDDDEKDDADAKSDDGDKGDKKDDDKKDDSKALRPSEVQAMIENGLRLERENLERVQLIASRPDLSASTKAMLADAPIAKVRAYVAEEPRRIVPRAASAQPTVAPSALKPQAMPANVPNPAKAPNAPAIVAQMHEMRRPAMTENDLVRAAHVSQIFGRNLVAPGALVHRDVGGRITKTELGVDVPIAESGVPDKSNRMRRGLPGYEG